MKSSVDQSVVEKVKILAKERETSFSHLWRDLILERFLVRLSHSSCRDRFILKGGTLLAKYLPIGRETKDLDFIIQGISNAKKSLEKAIQVICEVDLQDNFIYEMVKIDLLEHVHMPYTGARISLMAKFGGSKTFIWIDLGFGDVVEAVDYQIDLIASSSGPLFESKISLKCYPKEFIFAEKLETVIFRGEGNTRMKDFHDLYVLISAGNLNERLAEKVIRLVFVHRKTPIDGLPIIFDQGAIGQFEKAWTTYQRKLKTTKNSIALPASIAEIINSVNRWLDLKTSLCKAVYR
jgi:predicted nucleotidyltransferase component of viral defense system